MDPVDVKTIDAYSKRSDRTVLWIAMIFAIGGSVLDIGAHALAGASGLWGVWIPFCFLTIPPIHYLCRRVQSLQERIDELERRSASKAAA